MPEPSGSTGAQPSAEAVDAARQAMSALAQSELWSPTHAARTGLGAAYAIDAPTIHSRGYEEGRAAGRDEALREVVVWLRSTATAKIAWQFGGEHQLADAIEAAFPTTGDKR